MWILIITLIAHGNPNGGYFSTIKTIRFAGESSCERAASKYIENTKVKYGPDFVSAICVRKGGL
jgi:hypothetical protein